MQKRPVSLKDIASVLKISVSAVSRALRDQYDISPALRERVKSVAKEMGYRPNLQARGLINQSTNLIGIIVPDFVTYFYSSIIAGIEQVVRKRGYYPIVASSYESYENEIEAINQMLNIRVAGIIISLSQESDDYTHLRELESTDTPVVYFDRVPSSNDFYRVVSDNENAMYRLTKSLIDKGLKRIALITGPQHLNITNERVKGYKSALEEFGIELDENLILQTTLGSYDGTTTLSNIYQLKPRPEGVICMNDTILYSVILASRETNTPLTSDFTIAGFTDQLHSQLISPQLSVMTHPTYEIGVKSAEKLIQIIKNGKMYTEKREVCNCIFVSGNDQ